ncbi:unnamed protein product [Phaedon cochleariae]|uniref:Ionotropic receptor n=1 Tax=Phaedon cochleariae TaxID=80249 RepID=A0A9P0DPF6_PHACE|nr:unnamed protein product [Phaedon cochleariae]
MIVSWSNMICAYHLLTFRSILCAKTNHRDILTIGILFNGAVSQSEFPLNSTIFSNNMEEDNFLTLSTNIRQLSNDDSFEASKTVCSLLDADEGLVAVFGPPTSPASPLIESIVKNLNVPYILTSWKGTSYDGSETFLNFYPDNERLSKGIAALVQSLEWNGFVIIYETEEGLVRLQEVLKGQSWMRKTNQDFIRIRQLNRGPDYKPFFKHFKNSTETNFILDCKTENILPILQQVRTLGMLDIHFNYFLTSLDAHTVDYSSLDTNANITTIRLFDYKSEEFKNAVFKWSLSQLRTYNKRKELNPYTIKTETVLFHDALLYLIDALNGMPQLPKNEKTSCYGFDSLRDGTELIKAMRNREYLEPLSGPIQFDEHGNRVDFNLHLYNNDEELLATWSGLNGTTTIARNYDETTSAAVSNLIKIKVIVSTRIGEPYLMKVPPKYEGEILEGNDRYEGYSKDLMDQVAEIIGFTYELVLTENNNYGNWDEEKKRWNGLVGDLLDKKAHLAICDLTITHERQQVVDFSMPFMTLGISILHKYPDKRGTDLFAFLEPFDISVWIYSATLYLVVSLILFFIARMTPGDWENPHPCDENPEMLENIWGIKNCHWATLGTIMNQGCDILPKGISSRMALGMWWFFALIITNSYIANLTAFLTKDKMELPIKSAEDLAKQNKIKYGLLRFGSTEAFFKSSNDSIYQRMYMNMKSQRPTVFEKDNADGVQRVCNTKNSLYAFLMESTQIEYAIEKKCKLKQVGNWLDTKSYGIAMPINAPYRGAINKAVLTLQESGNLTKLKKKWWKDVRKGDSCEDVRNKGKDEKEGDLDLAKTTGTFLVLAVGVSIGISIGILEFLWNVRNVSVEEHLSYWEALKNELAFATNIFIYRKKIKSSSAESSTERKSDKIENKSIMQNMLHSANSLMNIN